MPFLFRRVRILALILLVPSAFPVPQRVGGWQTFGPALYQVNAVATESEADSTVYAAASIYQASQSALFRSADGGRIWTPLVEATPGEFYTEILVDPRQPQRILAGSQGNGSMSHISRSIDGGGTWAWVRTLSPSCGLSFVAGATPDTVLSACGTHVLRSPDGGGTWTDLPSPFLEGVRLTPGPAGSVLAFEASSIFRSTNEGGSWVSIGNAPSACPGILSLRAIPGADDGLVAGTGVLGAGGFVCGGVFRTADGGKTWSENALPGFYVTDVAVDPQRASVVFAAASFLTGFLPRGGVFESGNGGETWTNLNLPASGAVRLALSSSGRLLHAATQIGVFDRGFRRTTSLAPR